MLQQNAARLANRKLALLILLGHDLLEHVLQIDVHVLHAHVRKNLDRRMLLFDV